MKKVMKKLLAPVAIIAMVLGVGLSISKEKARVGVNAASSTTISPIADPAGGTSSDNVWKYTTAKNEGSNNPFNGTSHIRLYANISPRNGNGNSIQFEPNQTGYLMTTIVVTGLSNYTPATRVAYGTDPANLTDSSTTTWSGTTLTFTDTTGFTYFLLQNANTTNNTQLRISSATITYKVDGTGPVLSSLSHTGNPNKTSYYVGDSFDPTGLTFTATYEGGSTADVTDSVTFSELNVGDTTVTASYNEGGNTVTDTITGITVTARTYDFQKVTASTGLHFGATYIIGNTDGTKALSKSIASNNNNFPAEDTIVNSSGDISDDDSVLKVKFEIGIHQGTFALKTISTDPNVDGKYLRTASSSSNYLRLDNTITLNSSWKIDFINTDVSIIAVASQYTRNIMRFNNTSNLFSCYSSGQQSVALYLDSSTINHNTAATMVANEIMTGQGNNAEQKCSTRLPIIQGAYNLLSADAKLIFDTSSDILFVDARARLNYMIAWVAANPSSPVQYTEQKNNTVAATAAIGLIGLTSMLGYYFIVKRKKIA